MNSTNRLFLLVTVLGAVACVPIGQTNTSANTPSGQKQASQDLDATASAMLGVRYYIGQGVPQDYVRAASLFTQACDSGAQGAPGCNNLGVLYRDGRGVQQDQIRATALFKKACVAHIAAGCNNFGVSLDSGRGIVQNRKVALVCFKKACAGGDIDGCRNSQTLEKELEPIRYVSESDAPSGRDGSSARGSFPGPSRDVGSARGHGPNGEKASDSQDGDRLVITGKLVPAPVPSGWIHVGFLTNESIEFGPNTIVRFLNNGKIVMVGIYGDAAVNVDGSFTLLIDKKKLRDHKSWALFWFNPQPGGGRAALQGHDGRTYEFEVADEIGEINLGPIKFKM